MDEPELPPMLGQSLSLPRPPRPSVLTRKRTREDYIQDEVPVSATSSDPALFSGDDSNPGAENYATKRKKKMYTGSWWNHRIKAGRNEKKREFKRNYDSGIFMPSEESEAPSSDSWASLDDAFLRDQLEEESTPKPTRMGLSEPRNSRPVKLWASPSKRSDAHYQAERIIRDGLDKGAENFDLSSLSLTSVPEALGQLSYATKQAELVPGVLEFGVHLVHHLRLYLGNNLLRRVPQPVLDLSNLRTLSLRHNKLTTLPPGIRNLQNLESLNVGGNKLSYLPFEVIELIKNHRLRSLTAEPNPWLEQPESLNPGFSRVIPTVTEWINLNRAMPSSHAFTSIPPTSTVPPLVEIVLRQLYRLQPQENLRQLMPPETPQRVMGMLESLSNAQEDAGRSCTTCHRLIVQAGREWVEWWFCQGSRTPLLARHCPFEPYNESETIPLALWLPFKRVQCSATCAGKYNDWVDDTYEDARKRKSKNVCIGSEGDLINIPSF